jgi:outer membrane lipoprotein-sorting protein
MYQTDEPDNGTIELIFLDNPLLLTQWIVTDPDANEVRVGLIDVEMGIDLPASLFATPRVPTRDNGGRD